MPGWITPTLADLNDARVAELVDAFRTEALGAGQTDPIPRTIQTVVDEVRRCIGMCSTTPLDANPAAIPVGLRELTTQKILRVLKGRLLLPLTSDETAAESVYQKRLEMLTRCEWPVDRPDTPIALDPVLPRTGVELAGTPAPRRATAAKLSGL